MILCFIYFIVKYLKVYYIPILCIILNIKNNSNVKNYKELFKLYGHATILTVLLLGTNNIILNIINSMNVTNIIISVYAHYTCRHIHQVGKCTHR